MVIGSGKVSGMVKSRYVLMSVFKSSLPCSTSCMAAVKVKVLVIEPSVNRVVSGSTGLFPATSARP